MASTPEETKNIREICVSCQRYTKFIPETKNTSEICSCVKADNIPDEKKACDKCGKEGKLIEISKEGVFEYYDVYICADVCDMCGDCIEDDDDIPKSAKIVADNLCYKCIKEKYTCNDCGKINRLSEDIVYGKNGQCHYKYTCSLDCEFVCKICDYKSDDVYEFNKAKYKYEYLETMIICHSCIADPDIDAKTIKKMRNH